MRKAILCLVVLLGVGVASLAARKAVIDILARNNNQFAVIKPEIGKYAGRFVCDVLIDQIDLGAYLIERGHAKRYDGKRKPIWDWD